MTNQLETVARAMHKWEWGDSGPEFDEIETRDYFMGLADAAIDALGDAAKDTERLDWMIAHAAQVQHARDGDTCRVQYESHDEEIGYEHTKNHNTAREAIDAAVKGEGSDA